MDGTVGLGIWGALPLAGLSLEQATQAVRNHVFQRMQSDPVHAKEFTISSKDNLLVVVDVVAYNSKNYYVITDGAGFGEQIFPFPITGSETVLDALSKVNGLPSVASKHDIWVARRTPQMGMEQRLPVDYLAITQHGVTATNYQVLPGDRIYVSSEKIFRIDGWLQKVLTPVERVLGVTLLGSSTYNSIRYPNSGGQAP